MINREAIIADAVNGETSKAIARRHGCTVEVVYEIPDAHASEVLTRHNRARVLTIELQGWTSCTASFTSTRWKRRIPPAEPCA
jgi:hypothetical protein